MEKKDSEILLSHRCTSCNNLDGPLFLSDFPCRQSHMEEGYWVKGELFVITVLKRCLLDHGNSISWAEMKSDGSQVIMWTDWCSLNERDDASSTPSSVIICGNSFLCWCLPKMDDWFLWGSSVSSLHCPLPVPPHHYSRDDLSFIFQGMTFFISLFLPLSSALKERGARHSLKAAGSQWVFESQCHISLYKETSCMRHLQEGYNILLCHWLSHAVFVLLLIAGCYRLTMSRSGLWSVISNQCLANDTVGLLLTSLLGTGVDWRLTCGWKHGLISMVAHSEKHGNVLNSAAWLWIWVLKCLIVVVLQLEQSRSFHTLGRESPLAAPSPLWLRVMIR